MDAIVQSHITMIEEAEKDGVDALVLTLPTNNTELREAMEGVYERTRMPMYTIDAGHRYFEQFPIRAHIGFSDFLDGR